MNEKFTPAPWKVHGDWQILDSNERLIAQFEPLNDEPSNGNTSESFANAALIAAAPEMYNLLMQMHLAGRLGLDVHKRIEQLLAKARGEV